LKPWLQLLSEYCNLDHVKNIGRFDSFEVCWQQADVNYLLYITGCLEEILQLERKILVKAGCACARLILPYVPADVEMPRIAIETTERWCQGLATLAEVEAAGDAVGEASVVCYATDYLTRAACYTAGLAAGFAFNLIAVHVADHANKQQTMRQMGDLVRQIIPMPRFDKLMKLKSFL
jgi:hypothetical protein